MSRGSGDEIDDVGTIKNGFDYGLQVWVKDYIVQRCGHQICRCNANQYQGQDIRQAKEMERRS